MTTQAIGETLFPSGTDSASAPTGGESTPAPDGGDTTPGSGEDTLAGGEGADTLAGGESTPGAEYTFAFPEGFAADDALVADAKTVLKDAGVPPEKAQSIIDLYVKTQTATAAAVTAQFESTQREWLTEINAMPEFQGATRETSLTAIGKVLDEYGPEFKAGLLADPSVGNNPQVVRFMLNVAKVLSEGQPTVGGRPAPNGRDGRSQSGRSMGQTLFPSDNPAENNINA